MPKKMAILPAVAVRGVFANGQRSRDGFLNYDLQLDVRGAAFGRALEGGDALLEREISRDERL